MASFGSVEQLFIEVTESTGPIFRAETAQFSKRVEYRRPFAALFVLKSIQVVNQVQPEI